MKLCHIVHGYGEAIGGVEAYVQKLNASLHAQAEGLEIHVLFPSEEPEAVNGQRDGQIVLHAFDSREWHSVSRLRRILYIWRRFRELDAHYDFDLYHHHSLFDAPLIFGAAGLILRKKPVMFTMYGGIDALQELSRSRLKFFFIRATAREIFRRSHCTGNSRAARIIFYGQPCENIGMAVDESMLEAAGGDRDALRAQFGLADRRAVIYPSRIAKDKGQINAIRTIEALKDPFPDIRLYLIGPCRPEEEAYLDSMKEYVVSRGLERWVEFVGFVSVEDLVRWYLAADALLFTSFHEGVPFVILEAASLELPIVVSDVGGIPEIIEDGENGFLVEPGDIEGYGRALAALLEDAELRERFSREGRQRVGELVSFDQIARTCLEHYGRMLRGGIDYTMKAEA